MTQEEFLTHRLSIRLGFDLANNARVQNFLTYIDSQSREWIISSSLSPQFLKSLETNTIVSSTGASTRIEGAKLSDSEVEQFLRQTKMRKLETRDEQEVAGYLEMTKYVFEDFANIEFSELTIKQIHSVLLKYSEKDEKHRGGYKIASNQVVAVNELGQTIGIIFDPSTAEETPEAIKELVDWTQEAMANKIFHPLLIINNFVFEFLCIHPFKDGNGRTSRVLLKSGYEMIKYISLEKMIEETKIEYYLSLRKSTNFWKSEKEDVTDWLFYMFTVLKDLADKAIELLKSESIRLLLSDKQNQVWELFQTEKTLSRKEIADKTGISIRTVENIVQTLVDLKKIERQGRGRASKYRLI